MKDSATVLTDYKKNQIIFKEATPAKFLYLLKMGSVILLKKNAQTGEYFPVGHASGESILDEASILKDESHKLTAMALENTKILIVKKEDVAKALETLPQWLSFLLATLSSRQDETQKRLVEHSVIDPETEIIWEKRRSELKKYLN
jgi:CRP-like cAMP-binding protein